MALTDDDQIHWLALRMAAGLGTRKAGQLIAAFRTPQAIFQAPRSELDRDRARPRGRPKASPAAAPSRTPSPSREKLLLAGAEPGPHHRSSLSYSAS